MFQLLYDTFSGYSSNN